MSQTKTEPRVGNESEEQLIRTAIDAVSHCRWVVGECAAKWTQRYARGRTDADFGALIGVSPDQVYQRRRVWETFAPVRDEFANLKWSHFYAALTWDDALDALRWAAEMEATVAEMRAWRRAQRGEDLTLAGEEEEAIRYLPTELEPVQDPAEFGADGERSEGRDSSAGIPGDRMTLAGVARQSGDNGTGDNGAEYSPFRSDAMSLAGAKGGGERGAAAAEPPSPEHLVKRMTTTLERCAKVLTADFRKEFRRLPEPVRIKFFEAASELAECVAHLK